MTIKKFQGKTKEEAIQKAKAEFGENAVIMNVKEIPPKGIFGFFKSSTFEVTAAMEEKDNSVISLKKNIASVKKDNINLAADEEIKLPKIQRQTYDVISEPAEPIENKNDKRIEERLENISSMLEKNLGSAIKEKSENETTQPNSKTSEEFQFIRMLYNTLLKNEVDEKYINQVFDEVEKFVRPGNNLDMILGNVYQKLILRLGQPQTITTSAAKSKVVFFIGPTGVGKTTTIAKIASKYRVEHDKKVAFITTDTYRIAATDQLKVYANILNAPMEIVYSADEINTAISKLSDYDMIFVDTAGFSHKNLAQKEETRKTIAAVDPEIDKEVFLVLSATTKYRDLKQIIDIYNQISEYKIIFTKLDETESYGNILNIRLYANADLSYVTIGQNVPDDIEVLDTQKIVKQLLGGK